jgi:hypothetical protein
MADSTVRVTGVRELIRAADAAGKATKKQVRDRLRRAAEPVRADAASRLARYDEKSASRLGISVRKTGSVSVEQRLRRTTGQRPNFGVLQMNRALIPSLEANTREIERELEAAVDDIADIFERMR